MYHGPLDDFQAQSLAPVNASRDVAFDAPEGHASSPHVRYQRKKAGAEEEHTMNLHVGGESRASVRHAATRPAGYPPVPSKKSGIDGKDARSK